MLGGEVANESAGGSRLEKEENQVKIDVPLGALGDAMALRDDVARSTQLESAMTPSNIQGPHKEERRAFRHVQGTRGSVERRKEHNEHWLSLGLLGRARHLPVGGAGAR